jgi:hypothetical protein
LSTFDDLTSGQGEYILVVEYDAAQEAASIVSYNELATEFSISDPLTQSRILSFLYLLYCDLDVSSICNARFVRRS